MHFSSHEVAAGFYYLLCGMTSVTPAVSQLCCNCQDCCCVIPLVVWCHCYLLFYKYHCVSDFLIANVEDCNVDLHQTFFFFYINIDTLFPVKNGRCECLLHTETHMLVLLTCLCTEKILQFLAGKHWADAHLSFLTFYTGVCCYVCNICLCVHLPSSSKQTLQPCPWRNVWVWQTW